MHGEGGLEMFDDIGVQRSDDTDVVCDGLELREKLADPKAGLLTLGKLEGRAEQGEFFHTAEAWGVDDFSVVGDEAGFGIKGVEMGKAAGEEDEDEVASFGGELSGFGSEGMALVEGGGLGQFRAEEQAGEGGGCGLANKLTTSGSPIGHK